MADVSSEGLPGDPTPVSAIHAAAVTGDKRTLEKLLAVHPELKDKEDQLGRTPLMYCVLADRMDCAALLLKAGADVNWADRSRRSALHLAAQTGNYRFVRLLLARRANWMQKDAEETTPLHLATRPKSAKCLALLLKHMAPGEVDAQDRNKQTALHWSSYHNNPEHGRLLIRHNSNIGIPDVDGRIPLHWAAHSSDPAAVHMVRCILDAAPTESLLNWQDYEGRTPLHFAVAAGNEAVVEALTSYQGCRVTAYDNLFRTPLHWAALLGYAPIARRLLERHRQGAVPSDAQGATPLHYAAQSNYPETVEVFLGHPSGSDDADLEGRTAFMWAAGKGSDDVVQTMLALKPELDINLADRYGGTALHAASLAGHVTTVRLLLERGARADASDLAKQTPLFRACEMGHQAVVQALIEGGARVDLVDQDGRSPLHWAALGGNASVCRILMENAIDPNMQDLGGRTPLQCAAHGGYITCMAALLESKADANVQDREGRTALHWSCNNGYLDAVKLLLAFEAFPNQMESSEERYTPLDYALMGEHHQVVQFMLERGALSIAAIQDIAATRIQAVYKGYKVRRAFQERRILLMKHELLRKGAAAKKREEGHRKREAVGDNPGLVTEASPCFEKRMERGVCLQPVDSREREEAITSTVSAETENAKGVSFKETKQTSPPEELNTMSLPTAKDNIRLEEVERSIKSDKGKTCSPREASKKSPRAAEESAPPENVIDGSTQVAIGKSLPKKINEESMKDGKGKPSSKEINRGSPKTTKDRHPHQKANEEVPSAAKEKPFPLTASKRFFKATKEDFVLEEVNNHLPQIAKNKYKLEEESTPLSEAGNRKKEVSQRSSKSRVSTINYHSNKKSEQHTQRTSIDHVMQPESKGRTCNNTLADTINDGTLCKKKHASCTRLSLEGPRPASSMSRCQHESTGFFSRTPKAPRPGTTGNAALGPKPGNDAVIRGLVDGRFSPAGSSRPGSANGGPVKNSDGAKASNGWKSSAHAHLRYQDRTANRASATRTMMTLPEQIIDLKCTQRDIINPKLCPPISWQSESIEAIPTSVRLAIIERERARKELFRKKIRAASIIQEAWRRYMLRQKLSQLLSVVPCTRLGERWIRQITACIIQLAWGKSLDQRPTSPVPQCKQRHAKKAPAKATKPPSVLQQVYGSSQDGKGSRPHRPTSRHRLSARSLILGGH
ncbi:inversin [Lissotriton helveticus]